jgi:EthD domain
MIHQYILAAPKPGMSAAEFQDYWISLHAVRYASKIPQIKRYLIDARVPFDGDLGDPRLPHQGIAEIWLENEQTQLASLQTDEFLQGARLDEPNWAAFWLTIVLDTTAHEIVPPPTPAASSPDGVKLTVLSKRRPGLDLATYRKQSLASYASAVSDLPGLRGYLQAHTRDGFYVFGEASFDRIDQLWFDDPDAVAAALASEQMTERVQPEQAELTDPKYVFSMLAKEHWIIGPDAR